MNNKLVVTIILGRRAFFEQLARLLHYGTSSCIVGGGSWERFKDVVVSGFSGVWTMPAFRVFLAKSQGYCRREASGGQRKLGHRNFFIQTRACFSVMRLPNISMKAIIETI